MVIFNAISVYMVKLPFWQLWVQPGANISSIWPHFRFRVSSRPTWNSQVSQTQAAYFLRTASHKPQNTYTLLQCGAVIARSFFFKVLITDNLYMGCLLWVWSPRLTNILVKSLQRPGFKDSKTLIWQRNTCFLIIRPQYFIFMRPNPISYNIHWDKRCGHWILI